MDGQPDNLEPPTASGGDKLHSVVKAALGSVPLAGPALTELFVNLVKPPYERRLAAWIRDVVVNLRELGERGTVSFSDLEKDESFITTVTQATRAAIGTHIEDKRKALRNAVLNAALPGAPEDALRAMFIHWVDQFSEWHLRLLKLFQKPPTPPEDVIWGSLSNVADANLPELGEREDLRDLVWKELHDRRLVTVDTLRAMMSGGFTAKRTTELGDQFLGFIEEPSDQATNGE